MIIFPQIIVDVFVLNSLELIHGFKLLEKINYSKYKFENRNLDWTTQNPKLDRSLDINYRSLDNMNFSS